MKHSTGKSDKIIKAAIDQFSKKGYDKATIDDIANKSRVSKGIVFFYFKRKEKLVEKVALLSVPRDVIQEVNNHHYNDAKDLLMEFSMRFLEKYKERNMRNLLLMTMVSKDRFPVINRALEAMCFQEMDKMFSTAENILGHKIKVPIRRALFGSLLCYLIWWDKNEVEPQKYVSDLINGILKAVYEDQ
ncbi:MAG: TetR/AcrR family transcriptional regulator [Thermoplasmatales archaeon]